jgi:tetratricopeptide (TPR) repeat protein
VPKVDAWKLEFLWSLELGVWSLRKGAFTSLFVILLLGGCSTSHRSNGSPKAGKSTAVLGDSDPGTEKLARAHAHYAAGVIHELEGESENALEDFSKAAMEDPDNESLVMEVSRRLVQNKQPEKALEILSRAAERPNASGSIFARLGAIYSQLGKSEQAINANRVAVKKSPSSLAGYQNLFLNYLQNKQPQEALKVLDDAAAQSTNDVEFLIGLADLYGNFALQQPSQKDAVHAKALAVLKRVEQLKPPNAAERLRLADSFSALGDSNKAAEIYQELLNNLSGVPVLRDRVRAKLAEIYLRGNQRQRAVEQLQSILRDDPTSPQAYYLLGSIAHEEKKLPEAIDYFSKTIVISPDFEQAYYDLAVAQMNLNKTSDALATLEKARRRFPQNFVVEFLTGLAFSSQKGYAEAIQHFTKAEVIAQATEPKRLNETFYFQLGSAYERKGDYAEAEKYFQKSLQIAPGFAQAMNYLGYMWAEHDQNLTQAKQLIEKAVKLEPKNAAYLDSMGWVLFKLHQPKEALDYILKAVQLLEEPDATVEDHLGDIYAALKQSDKAREAWRKSVSLEANDEIQKKLDAVSK